MRDHGLDGLISEEGTDVVGELTVMLKKKSMPGVGIDLNRSAGEQAGQEVAVAGQDHPVAVAVGDEYGMRDRCQPFEHAVVGDAPLDDCVVMGVASCQSVPSVAASERAKIRPRNSPPAARLVALSVKNACRS